jgi:Tol biopolymer transport system component
VRLSPDGRLAAVELADDRYGTRDVWLVDTATNVLTRLTTHPATDWRPVFSPDGSEVAFASDRAGASTVFRVPSDGSGVETQFFRYPRGGAFPWDWSRDGKHLLLQVEDAQGRRTGFVSVPVDGGPPVALLEDEPTVVMFARFSPEGDRVAFVSTASGAPEVYVVSIADRRRARVSADGGLNPMWGRDGRQLFFADRRNQIMLATLDSQTGAVLSPAVPVFQPCVASNRTWQTAGAESGIDATSDGTRFLARCDQPDAANATWTVVVNWQGRLR